MKFSKTLFCTIITTLFFSCSHQPPKETTKTSINTNSANATMNDTTFKKNGYADVNGIKMYYEIYGDGKPLVLIHGGGSTIQTSFGRIIPVLSKSHQIIAVELQAHGRTSDRDKELSFEQDADDVAALLKTLNITKADFLGFSNGANTTLQIAIRHPELISKIVVASALLKRNGTHPQFWEFMKNGTFEQMPQPYKDAFLKVTPDSTKLFTMFHRSATRMINFKDMPDEDIKSIKCPVMLVNGDADVATPDHMREMSKLIQNCKLVVIPGTHGEYMGEITTLKLGKVNTYPLLPVMEDFLKE
jgi:pimeloyl-ACP methyl ester carboxylesterase